MRTLLRNIWKIEQKFISIAKKFNQMILNNSLMGTFYDNDRVIEREMDRLNPKDYDEDLSITPLGS